jgi:hypothetical protein
VTPVKAAVSLYVCKVLEFGGFCIGDPSKSRCFTIGIRSSKLGGFYIREPSKSRRFNIEVY